MRTHYLFSYPLGGKTCLKKKLCQNLFALFTALLCVFAGSFFSVSYAADGDKVVIISPHRKSIQQEFVPLFKEYYKKEYKKDVQVEWLDQGGTSDDVRFVRAKFAANSKTSGIDIFWGGGSSTFVDLSKEGFLSPYELPKELAAQIPSEIAGVPIIGKSKDWYGSAMSSFGIFFNRKLLKMEKLGDAPQTWDELGLPKYAGKIVLADPRRSGSATSMNTIVLQSKGWDKGWELLTAIAANTSKFTHSSSDPIKAVVSGDATLSMAIDFYANAKIGDLGKANLGFVLPAGQTVLDPDPVGILRGAPNQIVAQRFVDFVLSAEAQKLLVTPKGKEGGPKNSTLGRMSTNKKTYELTEGKRTDDANPFKMKAFLKLDTEKAAQMKAIFSDLLGALLIDTHEDLKKAWSKVNNGGNQAKALSQLAELPKSVNTEDKVLELAKKWDDNVFRNENISKWTDFAKKKYQKIINTSTAAK